MRAQAIEKLLTLIVAEVGYISNDPRLNTLKAKAHILLNRDDDRAASVIRELMNNEV